MKMNTKSKLVLSLGLLVAPIALVAKTPETAYVESYHNRTDIPVPISVVSPDIDPKYSGEKVVLEFVVDTAGKPVQIASASAGSDAELVATVSAAISHWQFAPALVNGRPVARKVMLPVDIVGPAGNGSLFAMK
jgi:hypothetical protein